ncbi:tryptophan-rich sensory protein [Brevundimonas sp. Root1279]|uniref:tryptophan-rich sensory protein n=1 Tax=Brevundimonas sp. Root1279 TaxID=1736443 RepID=UPI0006FC75B2|nr:tryptophan-rich sensory protein [Brevundimonas sp. Root1279]KQW78853.1 TspO protein [Brevundimonas sp. Root1279]
MTSIDDAFDDARDAAAGFLNAEERDMRHVALGVALTVGFAIAATVLARRTVTPRPDKLSDDDAPITERPRGPLSLVLPAVFSATTLSAVRVWNAPPARERTAAMGLWAAAQALNAVWIAMRPASRSLQIAAAMSSAGMAAAFAHEARKLDARAGKLAAPTGGGVHLANLVQGKSPDARPTVH